MSFLEDYEAALREEQRTKEALNRLRREHKVAKERATQMREYAKEFDVNLDGDKPTRAEVDGDTPENGDGDTAERTEGSRSKRHLEVVPD